MKTQEMMSMIAQGVININEGHVLIAKDSKVHKAMSQLCETPDVVKYIEHGSAMLAALKWKVSTCDSRDDTNACPSDCGCPAFNVLLKMSVEG